MKVQSESQLVRKRRAWVVVPGDVRSLSRSARQLAKSSASRIAKPEVARCLKRLKLVMAHERVCKLLMGDLLIELIDGHGLRAIDVARETGYRPADLSEMLKTARMFPLHDRPADVGYNQFLLATRMLGKFPRLDLSPQRALHEVVERQFSQHRDVTRHFSQLARRVGMTDYRLLPAMWKHNTFRNQPYHARFQDLLPLFPDRSISLLHIDPPYVYRGGVYSSRSALSLACDNADPVAAIQMVIDLLRDWQPKLAVNGVVNLWQPWGLLAAEIVDAVSQYNWELWGPIIWDKGRPQPGDFATPYSTQGEMLWMLSRKGDAPANCDGSSRESILRFSSGEFPSAADRQTHAFEKPEALLRHLLLKHTCEGDLVFDACGCTGGMSVAAINHGRDWVYAESNEENHHIGAGNIFRVLDGNRKKALG